jgi:predicted RNA-binding protein with PUA-like domain
MNYFLVKSEPYEYSIDDLMRDGVDTWNGVHNYQAINNILSWQIGDKILFYHSVKEMKIVGIAEVLTSPIAMVKAGRKTAEADIKFIQKLTLEQQVTLHQVKADPRFKDFLLVRNSRLSVMPVPIEFVEIYFGWLIDKTPHFA